MRSTLPRGQEHWLKESGLTQTQAAKALGITQARVSDLKRGKIGQFSLDMLDRLASRAGLSYVVLRGAICNGRHAVSY